MKLKHSVKYLGFTLIILLISCKVFSQWNPNYSIGTSTGKTCFDYNTTPDPLVEVISPVYTTTSLTYQWESYSKPVFPASPTVIGTGASYTFSAPLTQTTYYRRKATVTGTTNFVYSNIIEITIVSKNWENLNYVREHDVLKTGITSWTAVDQLAIGDKLQTTTYLDGLGRPVEKVSREIVTPSTGTLWGDAVLFSLYDNKGREPKKYLPYTIQYASTSGTESGKYKSAPSTVQSSYYTTTYNETAPYSDITFDNSPLNRVTQVNAPGTSWATSNGEQTSYDLNTASEHIQVWTIGYTAGDVPVSAGEYASNTLYKIVHYDENGDRIIDYTNKAGQLILSKQQTADAPSASHSGWLCTYNVYDDFGLLRYVLQPKAVNYLNNNGWSFGATDGQQVLDELCFRYEYDDKGRCILKKAPGAAPLRMIYDSRDRVVFMQDGNQAAKSTPEWTFNLYDDLDRVTVTGIYKTTKTVAQLQADINNSVTVSTITITTTGDAVNDLVVDNRDVSVTNYKARNSITFVSDAGGSFATPDGDAFTAEIDASAVEPPTTATVAVFNNPITSASLNNPSVTTILKYAFYDDYTYADAKAFDNTNTNTTAYPTSDANVIPIASSKRTLSMPTGSKVRVLGTNTFLASTNYYDEKGHLIQTNEDNIKEGGDVTTFQYHFDGRLLSTDEKHSTAHTGYSNFRILTKNVYDKIGRISSIQKKYYTNAFKTIASYDYDDMGRLKVKHLDPDYTRPEDDVEGLETLAYTYNIHNQVTGINKNYALKGSGYNKWGNFFGLYLGYDDRDNVFANKLLDGHVSGILWNTQGDDAQRRYVYSYDHPGRLKNAVFTEKQKPADAWDNSKMDFSVTGASGYIAYDANGNLTSMLQKGVMPGIATPVEIDKLAYTYTNASYTYTNKLFKVKDNTAQTATNGQSGDFKDGANGSTDDYVYDDNGNLTTDNNKKASSITYNYLDKPELITITGKGTIKIVYDAEGNKLQKIFTPEVSGGQAITTTYINEFVYKEDALQYINFEEGRLRVITPVSQATNYGGVTTDALTISGNMNLPGGKKGVYDFFIRDYQENVRMILTEEVHTGFNTCTMETARQAQEDAVFQGDGNEVENTRTGKPAGWNSNSSTSVSKLGTTTAVPQVGPNALLKVMAGDVVNATTDYYYQAPVTNTSGTTTLTQNIITSILSAITGGTAATDNVKQGSAGIGTALQPGNNAPFLNVTQPDQTAGSTLPKAYLTVLFFDERFNYVGTTEATPYKRVSQSGDNASPLVLANLRAPKNGYAYIYLSNESAEPVYFDNFKVALNRARIIEEDHYYAFGLKIAAISSQKVGDVNEGSLKNNYLYQGDFSEFDDDIGWNDFQLRNYDVQIGRWVQADPYDEFPSPYIGMANDPVNIVDPDGGSIFGLSGLDATILKTTTGMAIGGIVGGAIGGDTKSFFGGMLLGGAIGAGSGISWGGALKGALPSLAVQGADLAINSYVRYASYSNQDNNAWIDYNGTEVTIYKGQYGDTKGSTIYKKYPGTSGLPGSQNSSKQGEKDAGPVPEGDYSINLRPSFTRKASTNADGSTQPDIGVDLLPWENGTLYSGWGQWRARLQALRGTNLRGRDGNFYFHDSYKGYSHGCIETTTDLYYDLWKFRKIGMTSIKVRIKYSGTNTPTIGNTYQFPPPWWDGSPIQYYNGIPYPRAVIGGFPR